jgi:hypothetical protein
MQGRAQPGRIVQPYDPDVSSDLRALWPSAIPELHVLGAFPTPRPAIAIVGTREPEPEARALAFAYAREAARLGWAVVSGLARGVDHAAHEGALAGEGVTVAVAANGLDSFTLAGRDRMVERIVASGGAVISVSPPGSIPTRDTLLLRNEFTSGFADVVLAVQFRGRGGTLATVRHACRQNRMIATIQPPPAVEPEAWAGNVMLLSPDSPWRDRAILWKPAVALADPRELSQLFAQSLAASVDASHRFHETQKPVQPRLLEERAAYHGDE